MSGNPGKVTFAIPGREPPATKALQEIGAVEATALERGVEDG